jgi:hypothetical protein
MVERFLVGQRVRLKRRLATQPWGLLPRGTTGTNVGGVGEIDGEIAVWVRWTSMSRPSTPGTTSCWLNPARSLLTGARRASGRVAEAVGSLLLFKTPLLTPGKEQTGGCHNFRGVPG